MTPVTLRLRDATVRFGDQTALDGFTGTFAPGTVTALVGGDGAGKTTLLRLLAGRLALQGGTGDGLPVDQRNIGYQPADAGVWRNLSVAENIEFVAHTYGLSAEETRTRSEELLRRAGLDQVTTRLAGRLSGGMRRKLGVILSTLHRPGLVLLDEPTTGVDPLSRAELWNLIAGAAADGATVVFATTYLDEAERANALFLLGGGSLLAAGTPDEVMAQSPSAIWQSSVDNPAARIELAAPHAWRRGDMVYRWEPSTSAGRPAPGFEPAPGDLENTSIALLLQQNDEQGTAVELPMRGVEAGRKDHDTAHGALVQADHVTRRFGAFTALDGVSLTVRPGEVVGLLGGNGAGKTTLMHILLGLDPPTAGTATLFGERPSLDTRRHIGYVAQGLGLYPSLSAIENVEFAASVHGVTVHGEMGEFARSFGRAPVSALPLGAQRMLAYLTASVHQPDLLVLDEPTSGMDALARARLWRDLRTLADNGAGALVTTHYMQEAAQCDRLVMLTAGKVTAAGTVVQITGAHTSLIVTTYHW